MKKTQMPLPELCITGLGLSTSVGHDHKTACASIRAGLKRPKKLNNYYVESKDSYEDADDGLVTGHPVLEGDYNDTQDRIFTLLAMALNDLNKNAGLDESQMEETCLYLALPEQSRVNIEQKDVQDLIRAHWAVGFCESGLRTYPKGHAGMIFALTDAADAIGKGICTRVLIAGTDSLIGFDDLARLEKQERLKTILNSDGLIPGEAASAFLIESAQAARHRNAAIACVIKAISTAHELQPVSTGKSSTGIGLAQAITDLANQEKDKPLTATAVISDLNGEFYRFNEWAMLLPGVLNRINGEKNLICPARCIGDTGAASPGVSICIAARAMARGYLSRTSKIKTGQALIVSSSDTGERGAVLVGGE